MNAFLEMNALARNLICFWAILLILGFIVNITLSVRQRRYGFMIGALIAAAGQYAILQICRNVSVWKMGGSLHPAVKTVGEMPYLLYAALMIGFTMVFVIDLRRSLAYARTHITASAVKEAMDQSSTGICYYRNNGQPILTNHRMNALAFAITGRALLNGIEFFEAVRDRHIITLPDGEAVRFSHRMITLDNEPCHELIADDITEWYVKSESLRKNNEALKSQNQRMMEYGEIIDETVREQEVLNAKTRIHDEMNRLLLSTDNAIRRGTPEEKQKILETWEKNILLLCMEADTNAKNNAIADLEALAKVIGVTVTYDKMPRTQDTKALLLFSLAAEEAMYNAVKHAGAKVLQVQIAEDERALTAAFTNDGKKPKGLPAEGGGLSALRRRIEQSGGEMRISAENGFLLTISVPIGGKDHVL